jgi:hypothetical protein
MVERLLMFQSEAQVELTALLVTGRRLGGHSGVEQEASLVNIPRQKRSINEAAENLVQLPSLGMTTPSGRPQSHPENGNSIQSVSGKW